MEPWLIFSVTSAVALGIALVVLLLLARGEGTLAAIHWPRALLLAVGGSVVLGALCVVALWVVQQFLALASLRG